MKPIPTAGLVIATLTGAFLLGRAWGPEPSVLELPADLEISARGFSEALDDPDWVNRTYRLSAQLQHLNSSNLPLVLDAIEQRSSEMTNDELRLLMHAWTRFDPEGAFQFALFAPEQERRRMAGAVIYGWAQRDPLDARGALLGIQTTDLSPFLEERFVLGWISGGGLAEAHDYVGGLPPSKRRELLVGEIARTLARQSAQAVIDWAESVEGDEPRFKATVFGKASGALAEYHRPQAVAWVLSHYGEPHAEGGAKLVALNWAESDPDAAFAWLEALPSGEEKTEAVGFVFAYWLKTEPGKAAAWLEVASPSEALDPAMRVVAQAKQGKDPVVALQWARRIHDPGTRERTLVKIGQSWIHVDPEAARRWLAVSGLPRAAQKSILGSSPPTR
jgi:hypothetical protein